MKQDVRAVIERSRFLLQKIEACKEAADHLNTFIETTESTPEERIVAESPVFGAVPVTNDALTEVISLIVEQQTAMEMEVKGLTVLEVSADESVKKTTTGKESKDDSRRTTGTRAGRRAGARSESSGEPT